MSDFVSRPYIVFTTVAFLFGTIFLFLAPPFSGGDEPAHFDRIYQISSGHPFGETIPGGKGTYLPQSIHNIESSMNWLIYSDNTRTTLRYVASYVFHCQDKINGISTLEPMHFENTELYNPVSYTPQIIVMLVARTLNVPAMLSFYFIRLGGFLTWVLLCACGIKKMRTQGWLACILLLSPLSLQEATQVSADCLTVGFSIFFIGLIFEWLITKKPKDKVELTVVLVSIFLLSCIKFPYFLLSLLIILVPSSLYVGGKKRKNIFIICAISVLFISVGSWILISQKGAVSYRQIITGINIDPHSQAKYLVGHPFNFLSRLYYTYSRTAPERELAAWSGDFTLLYGQRLSLDAGVPGWATALYFFLLGSVYILLRENSVAAEFLSKLKRCYALLVLVILFLSINIIMFLTWSRIDSLNIEGISSRYFIPILPILIFILIPIYKKDILFSKKYQLLIPVCLLAIHFSAALAIYYRYYAY